jgi:cytochrome c551/c552
MGKFTFSLPAPGGSGGFDAVDNAPTAGATDAELVYSGDDPIVWDRVNSTRLRRGLPGLADIGFSRPTDGAAPASAGETFTVEGPPGMTEAQARQIFLQQNRAGSLVGLKPGDVVSSASQAAGGLTGALGQVAQGLAGAGGSALGALGGVLNSAVNAAGALGGSILAGAANVGRSIIGGITSSAQNTGVTNGITPGDFAKQAPALTSIAGIPEVDVRAGMAQANKLVGQGASAVSDTLGAGKFGMDAPQLEAAGLLKPGTSAYVAQGANSLTSVLNSPAVWTGKNGVNSLDNFLSSPAKQDLSFEGLMSAGMNALKSLGAPLNALGAASLTGVALNAAKSVQGTLDWAKGAPLPAGTKAAFDTTARDGAFAANLANTKLNGAVLQEVPAEPATNTANRATVDAASQRVVGNEKIPEINWNAPPPLSRAELSKRFQNGLKYVNLITDRALEASQAGNRAVKEGNLSEAYAQIAVLETIASDLATAQGKFLERQRNADTLEPPAPDIAANYAGLITEVENFIKAIEEGIQGIRQRAAALTYS